MKRRQDDEAEAEPHVFDQTNGVVDLGPDGPMRAPADGARAKPDDRTVAGIAMLSVKKP